MSRLAARRTSGGVSVPTRPRGRDATDARPAAAPTTAPPSSANRAWAARRPRSAAGPRIRSRRRSRSQPSHAGWRSTRPQCCRRRRPREPGPPHPGRGLGRLEFAASSGGSTRTQPTTSSGAEATGRAPPRHGQAPISTAGAASRSVRIDAPRPLLAHGGARIGLRRGATAPAGPVSAITRAIAASRSANGSQTAAVASRADRASPALPAPRSRRGARLQSLAPRALGHRQHERAASAGRNARPGSSSRAPPRFPLSAPFTASRATSSTSVHMNREGFRWHRQPGSAANSVFTGPGQTAVTVTPLPEARSGSLPRRQHEGLGRGVGCRARDWLERRGRGDVEDRPAAALDHGRRVPRLQIQQGLAVQRTICVRRRVPAVEVPESPKPALFTRISTSSPRAATRSSSSSRPACVPRSAAIGSARTPCSAARAVASARSQSSRRATTVTPCPRSASSPAIASPIPDEAPVISARRARARLGQGHGRKAIQPTTGAHYPPL